MSEIIPYIATGILCGMIGYILGVLFPPNMDWPDEEDYNDKIKNDG